MADHMGAFQGETGEYFEPVAWSPADNHHDRIRMRWRLCTAQGDVSVIGTDVGSLDPDGRFREIAGFVLAPDAVPSQDAGCRGPDASDWSQFPTIVRKYGDAWMAIGNLDALIILNEIWAEDGYYVDPFVQAPVIGRFALSNHMSNAMAPGHYVEVKAWSADNLHHDRLWIPWRHCCPTGAILLEGDDIGEIDHDGRLSRVTSFWNNEVDLPADVACD